MLIHAEYLSDYIASDEGYIAWCQGLEIERSISVIGLLCSILQYEIKSLFYRKTPILLPFSPGSLNITLSDKK